MAYSIQKQQVINYSPTDLREFFVYGYEWIDNLCLLLDPKELLDEPLEYVSVAREIFFEAGWEGDGDIKLMWVPPFVFPLDVSVSSKGITLWHVKQYNDGVSFIISPIELPFEQLGS